MIYRITVAVILLSTVAAEQLNKDRQQLRDYNCRAANKSSSIECRLSFENSNGEWDAINDNGCFQEQDHLGNIREYCPLQCPDSDRASLVEVFPPISNGDSACLAMTNFNVERKKNDWFLWRSGACILEQRAFKIACTVAKKTHKGKKYEKRPMENKEKEMAEMFEAAEMASVGDLQLPAEGQLQEVKPSENQVEVADNEDDLPERVNALLKSMFPSLRS